MPESTASDDPEPNAPAFEREQSDGIHSSPHSPPSLPQQRSSIVVSAIEEEQPSPPLTSGNAGNYSDAFRTSWWQPSRIGMKMMSWLPRSARSTLMKIATGTRGHNVEYYNDSAVAKVALTIDDAPSKSCSHFRKLLDMLQRLQVKVSFQVISSYAQMSEEHMLLMRRVVRDGHQLVNHSTHDERCTSLAESQFRDRLHTCQALIDTLAPHRARWFRPPSGVMNATMRRVCAQEGYRVALGDCYSDDPHISDPDFHVSTLLHSASAGSVLIVHCPEPGRREQTLLVLPRLVEGLRQKNLTLTTLDDLFATSTPPPPPVTTPKAPPVSSPPPDTLAPPVSVSAATASTREIDSADHRL